MEQESQKFKQFDTFVAVQQDIQPQCSFEALTQAYNGAVNVAGIGRPIEDSTRIVRLVTVVDGSKTDEEKRTCWLCNQGLLSELQYAGWNWFVSVCGAVPLRAIPVLDPAVRFGSIGASLRFAVRGSNTFAVRLAVLWRRPTFSEAEGPFPSASCVPLQMFGVSRS